MSQIEVSYEEMKQIVTKEIQKCPHVYLATSVGDFVTVRRMGFVSDGLKIWCVTDIDSRKYKQIQANPNVAIAGGGNLQIEGVASLKGHPMDERNSDYIQVLQEKNPEMYARVSRPGRNLQRPGTRLIEVIPKRVALNAFTANWDIEPDFQPHILVLNTINEKAHKIFVSGGNFTEAFKTPVYKE
jgi:general stress protein 26